MLRLNEGLRVAALAAVLLAGSCSSDGGGAFSPDGAENHPITVEPTNNSIKLPFSAPEAGLMPDDAARLEAFVEAYRRDGNGAISVSAPSGPDSNAAISYFGERLAAMGVPRSRILVGTHDVVDGDTQVELAFIGFAAHTDTCGDWSQNLALTQANDTAPNFGCSVQHNIAAMVTDPRDLVEPKVLSPADANRRETVVGKYEKGDVTQADKRKVDKVNEQSGAESGSGN
jgi:pilus assembly protein CpaD